MPIHPTSFEASQPLNQSHCTQTTAGTINTKHYNTWPTSKTKRHAGSNTSQGHTPIISSKGNQQKPGQYYLVVFCQISRPPTTVSPNFIFSLQPSNANSHERSQRVLKRERDNRSRQRPSLRNAPLDGAGFRGVGVWRFVVEKNDPPFGHGPKGALIIK